MMALVALIYTKKRISRAKWHSNSRLWLKKIKKKKKKKRRKTVCAAECSGNGKKKERKRDTSSPMNISIVIRKHVYLWTSMNHAIYVQRSLTSHVQGSALSSIHFSVRISIPNLLFHSHAHNLIQFTHWKLANFSETIGKNFGQRKRKIKTKPTHTIKKEMGMKTTQTELNDVKCGQKEHSSAACIRTIN